MERRWRSEIVDRVACGDTWLGRPLALGIVAGRWRWEFWAGRWRWELWQAVGVGNFGRRLALGILAGRWRWELWQAVDVGGNAAPPLAFGGIMGYER